MPIGNPRPLMPTSASATDNFWDDLIASKNDQLRSTMNAGINNVAPIGVVAPKERNPQTIEEIRAETEAIAQQNAEVKTKWEKKGSDWKDEKLKMYGIGALALYFIFK